jgi:hypothetical protein
MGRNYYSVLMGKSERNRSLGRQIILKLDHKNNTGGWSGVIWLGIEERGGLL